MARLVPWYGAQDVNPKSKFSEMFGASPAQASDQHQNRRPDPFSSSFLSGTSRSRPGLQALCVRVSRPKFNLASPLEIVSGLPFPNINHIGESLICGMTYRKNLHNMGIICHERHCSILPICLESAKTCFAFWFWSVKKPVPPVDITIPTKIN